MSNTCIILLIEDNPADAQLVLELLRDAKKTSRTVPEFRLERTDSLKAGLDRLSGDEIDLVLLDLMLPDSRGLETFMRAHARNPRLPFVIISGHDDEEMAIQAVRQGAQDYLVKSELNGSLLIRTMLYAVERKQAEEKIREQYEFLENVLESITHPFYVLDVQDYSILRANSAAGLGSGEIEGKCYALIHHREEPCDDPECPCPLKEVLRTKKSMVTEHIHHDEDGNTRYTEVHGFPLFDVDGNVVQMIKYNLDITERKLLEQKIVEISEREQTRIGQDLHDGLGQLLTGIKYMSEVLEKKLREKSLEEVADLVDIKRTVNEAIIQTKMLAKELYPVKIQFDGFMSALQEYALRINRMYGINCQFKYDLPITVTEHSTATHLYRIVQEAVNNAIQHGRADQIIIQLAAHDGRTTLCVKNNGVDIAENIDSIKGIGIHSMTYRAKMIGASLTIQSDEPQGTVVTCSWENSQVQKLPE